MLPEKVQGWLGHADIATTRLSDRRQSQPEESPTFKVEYCTGWRSGGTPAVSSMALLAIGQSTPTYHCV